jgi:hypothetical protein
MLKVHVTDGKVDTVWATEEKALSGWATVDLEQEYEVSETLLSDAPYGRTQVFDLEAKVNGEWKKISSGSAVGNELRLSFEPVKARYFRLNIRKASDTLGVAEFQLLGKRRPGRRDLQSRVQQCSPRGSGEPPTCLFAQQAETALPLHTVGSAVGHKSGRDLNRVTLPEAVPVKEFCG